MRTCVYLFSFIISLASISQSMATVDFTMKVLDDRGTLTAKVIFKQSLEQTIDLLEWKNWVDADRLMDRYEIKNLTRALNEKKYILTNYSSESIAKFTSKYTCTETFNSQQWKRTCEAIPTDSGTAKIFKSSLETIVCNDISPSARELKTSCQYTVDARLKSISTILIKRTEQTLALSGSFEKFSDLMVFDRSVEKQELVPVAYDRFQNGIRDCLFHQFYKNRFEETQSRKYKVNALIFKSTDLTCL